MRRIGMALVLAVSLVALAAPVASGAAPPAGPGRFLGEVSGTGDANAPCSSPLTLTFVNSYATVYTFAQDGTVTERAHITERDTFTANGRTLVSNPYTWNFVRVWADDSFTSVLSFVSVGTIFDLTLPNGTWIHSAGRMDLMASPGPWWTPDSGLVGDYAAFCDFFFD